MKSLPNQYMKLIMAYNPSVHAFDTFFYFKYSKTGYSQVKQKKVNKSKVNIFEMTKLLIPINVVRTRPKFHHWVLICVDINKREITFYDSISGSTNPLMYMQTILTYLTEEYKEKFRSVMDINPWQLLTAECPSQSNGVDWGVFVVSLQSTYLSKNVPFNFTRQHMFSFRLLILHELETKRLIDVNVSMAKIDTFIENVIQTV